MDKKLEMNSEKGTSRLVKLIFGEEEKNALIFLCLIQKGTNCEILNLNNLRLVRLKEQFFF